LKKNPAERCEKKQENIDLPQDKRMPKARQRKRPDHEAGPDVASVKSDQYPHYDQIDPGR